MTANQSLIVPLHRPQYVPASELLVSSIVHRQYTNPGKRAGSKGYRFLSQQETPSVDITGPSSQPEKTAFAQLLRAAGVRTGAGDLELANAMIDAVTGVASASGKAVPASPLTPHLALAQNLGGALNVAGPPDIGQALESMYVMGDQSSTQTPSSMGGLWLEAAELQLSQDPVLRVVESAFSELPVMRSFERREVPEPAATPWSARFPHSPFGWLHSNWNLLMQPDWVEALPPRVWTDWTTMVLRTGIAFGYLWESRWYEKIGRSLLGQDVIRSLPTGEMEELLPWPPARLPVKSRNVKVEIRKLVNRGLQVREILIDRLGRDPLPDPVEALESLRRDETARPAVREAMSGRSSSKSCGNTYETIIYSLQQRNKAAASTDYYGLLRHHGDRYSVVSPGTEWIAVVASLACPGPGGETHVGNVMVSLAQLGLRPELQEIVRALEAAGLAEGSADADHGVRVRSAF